MSSSAKRACAAGSIVLTAAILGAGFSQNAVAQTSDLVMRTQLRVCADPANMPFSNDKGEGFENKIAELIGESLHIPVVYFWFPQAVGFIRNSLRAKKCDLVIGYAQGDELVLNTNHYYSSAYALIVREASDLADLETLDDQRLKSKRIGVVAGTPPATNLAVNGLMANVRSFQLMVDRRHFSPAEDMVSQVASGTLDVAVLWGPIAGYYARNNKAALRVIPLVKEKRGPRMVYRITMGVRQGDAEWKRDLNRLIKERQSGIDAILKNYGVPLVPVN